MNKARPYNVKSKFFQVSFLSGVTFLLSISSGIAADKAIGAANRKTIEESMSKIQDLLRLYSLETGSTNTAHQSQSAFMSRLEQLDDSKELQDLALTARSEINLHSRMPDRDRLSWAELYRKCVEIIEKKHLDPDKQLQFLAYENKPDVTVLDERPEAIELYRRSAAKIFDKLIVTLKSDKAKLAETSQECERLTDPLVKDETDINVLTEVARL